MSTERVLLDTNIIVRLANAADDRHTLCADAVTELVDAGQVPVVAAQGIIEFWCVATRPADVNGLGWSTHQADQQVAVLLSWCVLP